MLTVLIVISILTWIAGFFINGFCLYSVLTIVPVVMFCVRRFGIHLKLSNIVTAEAMFLFFSVVWRLLFHKFAIAKFLLTLLVRVVFLIVVIYDDTVYVYVTEESKMK